MSQPSKTMASGTAGEVHHPEPPRYRSAAEAAADGPEAEAAYLKQLQEFVQNKDLVYPGQAGTIGWADFRPTVALARSERYWDNMTDDATEKRAEEENRPPPYGDGPPRHGAAGLAAEEAASQPRRRSSVKDTLKKVFKHKDHPTPGEGAGPAN